MNRPRNKTLHEVIGQRPISQAFKQGNTGSSFCVENPDLCGIEDDFTMGDGGNMTTAGETQEFNLGAENVLMHVEQVEDPRPLSDPQDVDEYIDDIYEHLKLTESDFLINHQYMKNQTDINEKMRGILIDWLVEVHLKFKLLPETLFLAVNLIDRYLEKQAIMRTKLQLVGVTAMLIACKYEEIYAPEVRDFVYITDKAYTKEEILSMETNMLAILEYNITVPSPFRFLEIFHKYLKFDDCSFMFCRYLLELFLIEMKMIKYSPVVQAAATVYITLKITKKGDVDSIIGLSDISEDKIRECAKDICLIIDNVEKSSLQAIRKKFSLAKYLEVAKIKFN